MSVITRLFLCFSFAFIGFRMLAQPVLISGVVNDYAAILDIDTCNGGISVSDTTGFHAGEAVLLIQMQGAEIFSQNNPQYGALINLHGAGLFERAIVKSVGAQTLFLQNKLLNAYLNGKGLQVVRIAQYPEAIVVDTIRPKPWNGSTGGVLALEVSGTLTLNAPVIADGMGFRGGDAYAVAANGCTWLLPETGYLYPVGNWRGAYKGEGIAVQEIGKELGRGPQANGGGGGNDHNSGGGGGAHVGNGGRGGDNDEPSLFGCDGYYPGIGGYTPGTTADRIFFGGGGGAGHANNLLNSAGGNGGGIIIISAGSIIGANPLISANGLSAITALDDGAGGGGAGGAIWLKTPSAAPNLQLRATGGDGGNTANGNANRCVGPGGGGAGGRILTNLPGILPPLGGQPGTVTTSSNTCNGTSNGATVGALGLVQSLFEIPQGGEDAYLPEILVSPQPDSACPGQPASFFVVTNPGHWHFQWEWNQGAGWQEIPDSSLLLGIHTDSLIIPQVTMAQNGTQFRCRVFRLGCNELVSEMAELTLCSLASPLAQFDVPSVNMGCGFATVLFENQSMGQGLSYHWTIPGGMPEMSIDTNPSIVFLTSGNYTATLEVTNQGGTDTHSEVFEVDILGLPSSNYSWSALPDGTIHFTNLSQNGISYSWDFGDGSPPSNEINPIHIYASSGTYVVTLAVDGPCGVSILQQNIEIVLQGTSVKELGAILHNMRVYPNPATRNLFIDASGIPLQMEAIEIFDLLGRPVLGIPLVFDQQKVLSLSNIPNGIYTLRVEFANGQSGVWRIEKLKE